jgi:transposase
MLDERTVAVGIDELIGWAAAFGAERLRALEDGRLLTPWLERQLLDLGEELLDLGEELVRVSPKLTVPERRAGRTRGKSDLIDALAVARAALREPDLPRPQPGEKIYRELKLLVVDRDDLVDERRRTQQRLRWHLHELDPTLVVPLRRLDRASHLERVGCWLARREQEVQVQIAREFVARCRLLTRAIDELNQELGQRAAALAPACSSCPAAAASRRRSCSPRSARSAASKATHNLPATAASRRSKQAQAKASGTGSTAAATGN